MSDDLPLAYELRSAWIEGAFGPILEATQASIRDRATTVVLGPAGAGKSQLLRALAGRETLEGVTVGGAWSHRGSARGPGVEGEGPFDDVVWLDQALRAKAGRAEGAADWRRAFETGARTVLLDEPDRHVPHERREAMVEAIHRHAETGAAVVVTHDLRFARSIADEVLLLCAGRFRARDPAKLFFESPRTDLAQHFVEQGNCWPQDPPPHLPAHFQWVIPGRLAGMGAPGLLGAPENDLAALAEAGISFLVTLTERPFATRLLADLGIEALHFPVRDMGVPGLATTAGLCATVASVLRSGRGVAVHCRAGLGRTGTILACLLVWMRMAASPTVVADLRALGPLYVQSQAQHDFIRLFGEYAGG